MGVFDIMNRRTNRAPTNPLDRSTIVSIFPKLINERKHTIEPGVFVIPPGTFDKPAILNIGPSSWWKELEVNQPLLEIPISSIQIADSVVKDYCNGLVGCNMGSSMPGLFYIPGEHSLKEIKDKFSDKLKEALAKQKNYYTTIIKMADTLWARSNGNPLAISDDARMAAKELQMNDKPWLKDYQNVTLVQCKACGSLKNPDFPVCGNCKHIDNNELATKLGIKLAV